MPKSKPTARTTKKTTTKRKTSPLKTGTRAVKPVKAAGKPRTLEPAPKTRTRAVKAVKPPAPEPEPKAAAASKQNYTDEYVEYMERYAIHGEGRQHLGPSEFDRYDEEMWELIDLETEQGALSDEQTIRYRELEYMLLLDNEF